MEMMSRIRTSVYNILFGGGRPRRTDGDDKIVFNVAVAEEGCNKKACKSETRAGSSWFKMPVHYPRYKRGDYENMEEWKLDNLLQEYGLVSCCGATLEEKRAYAIATFLWPNQL